MKLGSMLMKAGKTGAGAIGAEYLGRGVSNIIPVSGVAGRIATPAVLMGVAHLTRKWVGDDVSNGINMNALLHLVGEFLPFDRNLEGY